MGRLGCLGHCNFFKKVLSNIQESKKYCTTCAYYTQTDNVRCECCKYVYRNHKYIPTGKKIGRPKGTEIIKVHPLFDW